MRYLSFLIICSVTLAVSSAPSNDGRSRGFYPIIPAQSPNSVPIKPKVVGGSDAEPGEIPYQVSLQIYDYNGGKYHTCGGSIINKFHIITAAHCVYLKTIRNMDVVAGAHNIFLGSTNEQRMEVQTATVHPSFNPDSIDWDIAVIKLKYPLTYNKYVQPIQLADANTEPSGKCLTSGWGNIVNNGSVINPAILQKAELNIIPRNECQEFYGDSVNERMVCAGVPEGGIGSCHGDSGGPLVISDQLVGVVSWGMYICALIGEPSVYVNVAYFRDWIEEIISD